MRPLDRDWGVNVTERGGAHIGTAPQLLGQLHHSVCKGMCRLLPAAGQAPPPAPAGL